MALTGAVIFAFIISSVGLRNCVCVDTLPSYLKTAGTAEGTGTTAPDSKKNASLLAEWADFHFPTFFLDQMRLVACVDSGMCKRQLHGWFARMAAEKGIIFTALPLSVSFVSFIAGYSGANFMDTSGLSIWLVFVPAIAGVCEAHAKFVVFGYSQCYGLTKGDFFGAKLKFGAAMFVRGLAGKFFTPFSQESPFYWLNFSEFAPRLTNALGGVLYLTPSTVGGVMGGAVMSDIWAIVRTKLEDLPSLLLNPSEDLAMWLDATPQGKMIMIKRYLAGKQAIPQHLWDWARELRYGNKLLIFELKRHEIDMPQALIEWEKEEFEKSSAAAKKDTRRRDRMGARRRRLRQLRRRDRRGSRRRRRRHTRRRDRRGARRR